MNTEEIEEELTGLRWDKPYFYLDGKVFTPNIYEVKQSGEIIPEGCNTVSIRLDGKMSADLDWKEVEDAAQKYVEEGFQLFWMLDLGLFEGLKLPLTDQTQFLSLILSLEHLRDTLWKKFKNHTLGICLYQGPANFLKQLKWDNHLQNNYLIWGRERLGEKFNETDQDLKSIFARDAVAEYLTGMANRMPDAMQMYATLDVDPSINLMMEMQLLHRECFDRIHLIIKTGRLPTLFNYDPATVGICLPGCQIVDPAAYIGFKNVLESLLNKKIPFRIIPEAYLINEWDGLDYLIVNPEYVSAQGERKLQGFCAAGGTVINPEEYNSLLC